MVSLNPAENILNGAFIFELPRQSVTMGFVEIDHEFDIRRKCLIQKTVRISSKKAIPN